MTRLTTKELYGMFLTSDWWIRLSRTKRRMIGKCEQCGKDRTLESHHVRYPENWFDTQLSDLRVLCRDCHEREHGIAPTPKPAPKRHRSPRRKRRSRAWWQRFKKKQKAEKMRRFMSNKPWVPHGTLNFHRMHWVSRGTSSN